MEKEAVGTKEDQIDGRGKKKAHPRRMSPAGGLLEETLACYGEMWYCGEIVS